MVARGRFELPTHGLWFRCSKPLSYLAPWLECIKKYTISSNLFFYEIEKIKPFNLFVILIWHASLEFFFKFSVNANISFSSCVFFLSLLRWLDKIYTWHVEQSISPPQDPSKFMLLFLDTSNKLKPLFALINLWFPFLSIYFIFIFKV